MCCRISAAAHYTNLYSWTVNRVGQAYTGVNCELLCTLLYEKNMVSNFFPILKILSLLETEMNDLQNKYNNATQHVYDTWSLNSSALRRSWQDDHGAFALYASECVLPVQRWLPPVPVTCRPLLSSPPAHRRITSRTSSSYTAAAAVYQRAVSHACRYRQ